MICLACNAAELEMKQDGTFYWCGQCNRAFTVEAVAEIERLRGIVDKLPKTADGVPVVPFVGEAEGGTELYRLAPTYWDGGLVVGSCEMPVGEWYSTREAAEAACEAAIAAEAAKEQGDG